MRALLLITLVTVLFCASLFAQKPSEPRPAHIDLSKAYGYALGQENTLAFIERKFPDLSGDVAKARERFNATWGATVKNVEATLKQLFGEKWDEYKSGMEKQLKAATPPENAPRDAAVSFIGDVNKRADGEIVESVLGAYLTYHPDFQKTPGQEFQKGYTNVFRSKGHAKSSGLDVQFKYPRSWSVQDDHRPNILINARSEQGRGMNFLTLTIKPFPSDREIGEKDLEKLFTSEGAQGLIPAKAKIVIAEPTKIGDSPAIKIVYDHEGEAGGAKVRSRTTSVVAAIEKRFVNLACAVTTKGDESALDEPHKKFEPLFLSITQSLALKDSRKK